MPGKKKAMARAIFRCRKVGREVAPQLRGLLASPRGEDRTPGMSRVVVRSTEHRIKALASVRARILVLTRNGHLAYNLPSV
jgi:hypothetical protein